MKRLLTLFLILMTALCLTGCFYVEEEANNSPLPLPAEDGVYDSPEDVALYLNTYGCLPRNYITKEEAKELGWEGGSVEQVAPGCCIGGSYFGNYEGLLPEGDYLECDVNTLGKDSRGPERLVYDEDVCCIYYTPDHYKSFEQLY